MFIPWSIRQLKLTVMYDRFSIWKNIVDFCRIDSNRSKQIGTCSTRLDESNLTAFSCYIYVLQTLLQLTQNRRASNKNTRHRVLTYTELIFEINAIVNVMHTPFLIHTISDQAHPLTNYRMQIYYPIVSPGCCAQ